MVAGRLQEKNGNYYIILDYKDLSGKRKMKWIATGLPIKGNKKKAEDLLREARKEFNLNTANELAEGSKPAISKDEILFSEFLEEWLEIAKQGIEMTTYSSYCSLSRTTIIPHFKKTGIKLVDLQARDIQAFYTEQLKRVSANTVIHYHAVIHKALKYAVKMDMIPINPAQNVERPRMKKFIGSFYDSNELNELFNAVKGMRIELAVLFGAYYGLRRSEIVGLKWDCIDFKQDCFSIKHTVTTVNIDGKQLLVEKDRAKNKSSMRTLPLMPMFRDLLLNLKDEQAKCRKICRKSYNTDYLEYIYVDEMGNRIKPNYITERFPKILSQKNLRKIRFHDLRHSCASLLLANGISMKQIQEWLGHSDFSTTANTYSHLDYSSKVSSARAITDALKR